MRATIRRSFARRKRACAGFNGCYRCCCPMWCRFRTGWRACGGAGPDLSDQTSPLLGEMPDWFDNPRDGKAALLERVAATEPSDEAIRNDHDALLLRSLCARLRDLITFW